MISTSQLYAHLQKLWAAHNYHYSREHRPGLSISELVELSEQRNRELNLPSLDLWIAIFDEFISWQISLLTIFYGERKTQTLSTNFDKSITMILMKTVGDSFALRHLILLGFDTEAKTILRSTAEYMELLVAILSDPSLSDEFSNTDTPARAKQFWEKQLRSKRIRKKIRAAWCKQFPNKEFRETVEWFADWGSSSNAVLSALAHPSLEGGMFTAVPLKQSYDDDGDRGTSDEDGLTSQVGIGSVTTRRIFQWHSLENGELYRRVTFPLDARPPRYYLRVTFGRLRTWHRRHRARLTARV